MPREAAPKQHGLFAAYIFATACDNGQSRCRRRNGAVFDPEEVAAYDESTDNECCRPSDHRLTCRPTFNAADDATAAAIAQHALEVSGEHGCALNSRDIAYAVFGGGR